MIYPEIPLAQVLIEICKGHHLKHIVISPGSRNAPLTIGFANNPAFTCYSIADERSAGFFALGIAQQTKQPVVLVCTSGSALLNYYPAIAEAFYSQIPLIVLSADRPSDKIDMGDGQTIRQENVYSNHILYSANLTEQPTDLNIQRINLAINQASSLQGPVHINAPFEEPLYNTVNSLGVTPSIEFTPNLPQPIEVDPYVKTFVESSKILVLIGVADPNTLSTKTLNALGNNPNLVVLTEVCSNSNHPNFIAHIDRFITPFKEQEFKEFQPDLLITLGGMVVSKRIKAFLRSYKPKQHWHIDSLRHYDTYQALTHRIVSSPEDFLSKLVQHKPTSTLNRYQKWALDIAKIRQEAHITYISQIPFSDMLSFDILFKDLPKSIAMQISNSASIRYAQLFDIDPSIDVYCNRGTSGIDGSTSTAIGAAVVSQKPTVLITGDISFFYDNNALWNQYITKNFKIIIVNNQGGGIFRILPGHQDTPTFNTFFETQHKLTAIYLAQMHGFAYYQAHDADTLKTQLKDFLALENQPAILEIHTPGSLNDTILKEYFKNLD